MLLELCDCRGSGGLYAVGDDDVASVCAVHGDMNDCAHGIVGQHFNVDFARQLVVSSADVFIIYLSADTASGCTAYSAEEAQRYRDDQRTRTGNDQEDQCAVKLF